jgi:hypothetical protein
MDDPLVVRVLEGSGKLRRVPNRLGLGQARLCFQQCAQRVTVNVLHHNVVPPFVNARVVHLHDVRVLEARNEPRLALEARDKLALLLAGKHVAQHLDGNPTAQALVLRQPHFRHAARSDEPLQAVS